MVYSPYFWTSLLLSSKYSNIGTANWAIPMAELFRRGLRLGPSRSAADAGGVRQIQFRRGTKNSAAESAADSADCRGTNLFRRGSDRIRGGLAELPPAECTEKGPRESATRIFRECPPRTFEKFRLLGTIPRREIL